MSHIDNQGRIASGSGQFWRGGKALLAGSTAIALSLGWSAAALAQDSSEDDATAAEDDNTIVVSGNLGALPIEDVGSVFGFDKTLLETPRSASTISSEQMERFGITDIYDLVAQAPGTFTNSFFGVGGALDIRGTPGEVYFRGVRRLDNPGNYPTPIAASERIDIVRGPASPIYGPSKTGGYMNFVPKSARAQNGSFLTRPEGEVSFTTGSWERALLEATILGPITMGETEIGYSLYVGVEDSGSYYRNMGTDQTVVQAAFETDLTDGLSAEFGGMYQNYEGQQNGGWNRLTQELVDDGTYITGAAQPIDTDGDGQLSQPDFDAFGGLGTFGPFGGFACGTDSAPFATAFTDQCFIDNYSILALTDTGTTKLSRRNTLTGPNDYLKNRGTTLYFDLIWESDAGLEIKNQLFYDSYENENANAYGFSQFHDSWVIEDKIVVSNTFETDLGDFSVQLSPSIRHTDFKHGDDFDFEYFHRVDLTVGYNALSDRLLSLECDCDYSTYLTGSYTDYAMAGLVDLDFDFGLDILFGGRYDWIDAKSASDPVRTMSGNGTVAEGSDGDWSWTASVSYRLPFGLIPYGTISRQTTVVAGQGAEIDPGNIIGDSFLSASKLYEAGVKGSWLDETLYAAVSVYKQERTDYNVQSITVNQAVQTKGMEAEIRWAVNDALLVTGAYTRTNVYNLTGLEDGALFSFFGIEDLVNVTDPTLFLGGQPLGLVLIPDKDASRRAGIPENLFSLTATYETPIGLALSGSVVAVDSVYSGQSQAVKLPSYTLVDVGASYQIGDFLLRLVVKNLTDERYFRANFTELFGSTIALPEKPRSFQASLIYSF